VRRSWRLSSRAVVMCDAVTGVADHLIWVGKPALGVQALWDERARGATGFVSLAALRVAVEVPVLLVVLGLSSST
jgi:hypothetical protein